MRAAYYSDTQATSEISFPMSPSTWYNHSPDNISGLTRDAESRGIIYTTDTSQCNARSITKHSIAPSDEVPRVVFYPKTTEETSTILKACNERRIAVTSYSGGTSFGGALTATRGGVCISFERMKDIVAVHEDDMDVVVQPGIGWVELNEHLSKKGLFFPVDPAPGASIGGMVSGFRFVDDSGLGEAEHKR